MECDQILCPLQSTHFYQPSILCVLFFNKKQIKCGYGLDILLKALHNKSLSKLKTCNSSYFSLTFSQDMSSSLNRFIYLNQHIGKKMVLPVL